MSVDEKNEIARSEDVQTPESPEPADKLVPAAGGQPAPTVAARRAYFRHYVHLPLIFLTVALFGGLRVGADDSELLFVFPPLLCFVFALMLVGLFVRGGMIQIGSWFDESSSALANLANALVLVTIYFASAQVFNSLIPPRGLPSWVIAFCFFWVLWNHLFSEFDPRRLLKSLGALFGLAFAVKYIVLLNLVTEKGSWLERIWNDPGREALSYIIDIPRYAGATGYIQLFVLLAFMFGLWMVRPSGAGFVEDQVPKISSSSRSSETTS